MDSKKDEQESKLSWKHIVFYTLQNTFDLLGKIVGLILYLGLAYLGYLSIEAIAGKTTITNIIVGYFTSKESDYGLPWIVSIVAILWAISERKEKKRKTEKLQEHIRNLETYIDPTRTSSGLMPNGDSNPKD